MRVFGWFVVLCVLWLAGCQTTHPASKRATLLAQHETSSDETAVLFLEALRRGDYEAAHLLFNQRIQGLMPVRKLERVWKEQTGDRGAPRSWTIVQRTERSGQDVRVALLGFEHGALMVIVVVEPRRQELSGLWFQPAPDGAAEAVEELVQSTKRAALRAEKVIVGKAPYALDGTLLLPEGKGPFPAAVLVHGSGPNDQDESIGANKPFRDLAEGLASRGIAVLRYNKRTFQYRGRLNDVTVDDEVIVDAVAALALLRARTDVDPSRLVVVGHSLGAQLAPEIAERAAPVAGIVLLAPPGRPFWDAVIEQMRYLGAPSSKIAQVEQDVARLKANGFSDGSLLGVPASYFRDLNTRDAVAAAKRLRRPVLILRGSRDYQVTEDDLAVWRAGLAGMSNVEIQTVTGANHLMIQGKGKPGPAEYAHEGHVSEVVIDKLASFVRALAAH